MDRLADGRTVKVRVDGDDIWIDPPSRWSA